MKISTDKFNRNKKNIQYSIKKCHVILLEFDFESKVCFNSCILLSSEAMSFPPCKANELIKQRNNRYIVQAKLLVFVSHRGEENRSSAHIGPEIEL